MQHHDQLLADQQVHIKHMQGNMVNQALHVFIY